MKITEIFKLIASVVGDMAISIGQMEHGIMPKRSKVQMWVDRLKSATAELEKRL